MNTNARYILTATGVAAGLFVVGATANALVSGDTPPEPIGAEVVLPSASPVPSPEPSQSPEHVEYAEPSVSPAVLGDSNWSTSGGSGAGDDDDHEGGEREDHEDHEDHEEHEDD